MTLSMVLFVAMFALSEGATVAIILALITAVVGPVAVAVIQTKRTRKVAEAARETLGEKPENDDRSMIQLMHDFIATQAQQDTRIAAHDALHVAHDRRLDEHHRRIAAAERALKRLHGDDAA